jgi:hypothetical protein
MRFSSSGDGEEAACYRALVELLYPDGLACPECRSKCFDEIASSHTDCVPTHRCARCRCYFNAWSGTLLQGACSPPSQILAELMSVLEKVSRRGRSRSASAFSGVDQGATKQEYAPTLLPSGQFIFGGGS